MPLSIQKSLFLWAFIALVPLFALSQKQGAMPNWVKVKPNDKENYLGLGSAPVEADAAKFQEAAKQKALANMSSDIVTALNAETNVITTEVNGKASDEFNNTVKAITDNMLEGYEQVDSYNDGKFYHVLYKLNKQVYLANKRKRFGDAITASDNSFNTAVSNEKSGEVYLAFMQYTQAIEPMVPFLVAVLEPEFKGKCTEQANKIATRLTRLMSNTVITPVTQNPEYKFGQRVDLPLEVRVQLKQEGGNLVPIRKFPVLFKFTGGKGQFLNDFANSDEGGIARALVKGIEPNKAATVIVAEMNTADFKILENKNVLQYSIGNTAKPRAIIRVKTQGVSVAIESEEKNLGTPLSQKQFEPMLKDYLASKGCSIVPASSNPDFTVTIKADTRQGTSVAGQSNAYMDGSISAVRNETGEEVAVMPIANLKGFYFDFPGAGMDTYKRAREKMNKEFLPAFLKKLFE